jgi:hypothetical protein
MHDEPSRLAAFFAVVVALLYAGLAFHDGDAVATIYFMAGAILVTIVTHLSVKKQLI